MELLNYGPFEYHIAKNVYYIAPELSNYSILNLKSDPLLTDSVFFSDDIYIIRDDSLFNNRTHLVSYLKEITRSKKVLIQNIRLIATVQLTDLFIKYSGSSNTRSTRHSLVEYMLCNLYDQEIFGNSTYLTGLPYIFRNFIHIENYITFESLQNFVETKITPILNKMRTEVKIGSTLISDVTIALIRYWNK